MNIYIYASAVRKKMYYINRICDAPKSGSVSVCVGGGRGKSIDECYLAIVGKSLMS